MAILTVSEQADMLNRVANQALEGGRMVPLYPSYARAILDVLAALEAVTAERDELSSLLAANVVVRAAQTLELNGVTAERDALAARFAAMEPDWTEAPEWAMWWAIDEDGSAYWYVAKPEPAGACWATDSKCEYIQPTPIAWRSSLRQRPVIEVTR